jgi:hypothetical protein
MAVYLCCNAEEVRLTGHEAPASGAACRMLEALIDRRWLIFVVSMSRVDGNLFRLNIKPPCMDERDVSYVIPSTIKQWPLD